MTSYMIESEWNGSRFGIYLVRRSFWTSWSTFIKSNYANNIKDRDDIIQDYKLNKVKYINEYETKESLNVCIKI